MSTKDLYTYGDERLARAAARFLPGLDPVKQSIIFRKAMAALKPKSIRLKYADLILYRD